MWWAAVPCRTRPFGSRVTRSALDRRPSACETDGRSAPTSCPISRCVSGSGTRMPSATDDPPALGEVPEQQRDAHVGARVAGRRAVDVELHRPADRAAQQRVQDLRPRPDPLGERLRRAPRRACARARARTSPTRAGRRRRRSSTARAGRRPRRARRRCDRRPARRARRRRRSAAGRGRRAAAPAAGSGRTRRRRSPRTRAVTSGRATSRIRRSRSPAELLVDVEQVAVAARDGGGPRPRRAAVSPRTGSGNGPGGGSPAPCAISLLLRREPGAPYVAWPVRSSRMPVRVRFRCQFCDAKPDPETQRRLERGLRELVFGEYLDVPPGRWLVWHGRGPLGPTRYACAGPPRRPRRLRARALRHDRPAPVEDAAVRDQSPLQRHRAGDRAGRSVVDAEVGPAVVAAPDLVASRPVNGGGHLLHCGNRRNRRCCGDRGPAQPVLLGAGAGLSPAGARGAVPAAARRVRRGGAGRRLRGRGDGPVRVRRRLRGRRR